MCTLTASATASQRPARILQHLQVHLVRLAGAAVLLRVGQAEQPGPAEGAEHLARELARAPRSRRPAGPVPGRPARGSAPAARRLVGGQDPVDRPRVLTLTVVSGYAVTCAQLGGRAGVVWHARRGVNRPLLLVDAPSLYFRAYFGIPESAARAPDGTPVNAVRGFLDMLATLIRTRRPDRLVCALDADWRPAWRVDAASPRTRRTGWRPTPRRRGAGARRAGARRCRCILEVLAAFGIPAVGRARLRGRRRARHAGRPRARAGRGGHRRPRPVPARRRRPRRCGCSTAAAAWPSSRCSTTRRSRPSTACRPPAYADFAALRGDPSDGLPGVPGVGEKTAARLIARYGGLDAILAALDDPDAGFAPGLRGKLAAARAVPGGRARRWSGSRSTCRCRRWTRTLPPAPARPGPAAGAGRDAGAWPARSARLVDAVASQ